MKTQLEYFKYLTTLQKCVDFSTELLNALMHPSKSHRPLNDLVADAAGAAFILAETLDNDPPTE